MAICQLVSVYETPHNKSRPGGPGFFARLIAYTLKHFRPFSSSGQFLGVVSFIQVDRYHLGQSLFLHGDAEKGVGKLHAAFIVGDHDDLGLLTDYLHQIVEPMHIGVVQGRINLIHEAKGGRLEQEDGENKADGRQGFLATGQKAHAGQFFTWRVDHEFHPGLQGFIGIGHFQTRRPPLEQAREYLLQFFIDLVEGFQKLLLGDAIDFADHLVQSINGFEQIIALFAQEIVAILLFIVFPNGFQVDIADIGDFLADGGQHLFQN